MSEQGSKTPYLLANQYRATAKTASISSRAVPLEFSAADFDPMSRPEMWLFDPFMVAETMRLSDPWSGMCQNGTRCPNYATNTINTLWIVGNTISRLMKRRREKRMDDNIYYLVGKGTFKRGWGLFSLLTRSVAGDPPEFGIPLILPTDLLVVKINGGRLIYKTRA